MKLYSAEQCQQIDRIAIDQYKMPGLLLMKKAAWCAFQSLLKKWPNAQQITIVCGSGNNGGDGFMLGQYASLHGMAVSFLIPESRKVFQSKLKGDALSAYQEASQLQLPINIFSTEALNNSDLIIDALFGTGLDRNISDIYQNIIETINGNSSPVMALDLPSGIQATTGKKLGVATHADMTVTFIGQKPGLFMFDGSDYAGEIELCNLNLPTNCYDAVDNITSTHTLDYWQQSLPSRPKTFHKGSTGTVAMIGGNLNMMGAIQLSAQACLKSGAGLVKVVTQGQHTTAITAQTPELMCYEPKQLSAILAQSKAIAIGPGLGMDSWATELFQKVIHHHIETGIKTVIDADALKLLADQSTTRPKKPNWVLTPHPGEAAILLNCTAQEVQNDRFAAIEAIQKQYGGTIVLKGNGTLIFDGETMELCTLGNPGMAVGGMGDVLTGMIASFLGQGMACFEAACLGVYQHAALADEYVQSHSQASLTPSDMIRGL